MNKIVGEEDAQEKRNKRGRENRTKQERSGNKRNKRGRENRTKQERRTGKPDKTREEDGKTGQNKRGGATRGKERRGNKRNKRGRENRTKQERRGNKRNKRNKRADSRVTFVAIPGTACKRIVENVGAIKPHDFSRAFGKNDLLSVIQKRS
jgi:hypothetical protein